MFLSMLEDENSVTKLLKALDTTVIECSDKIWPGYLEGSNIFAFCVSNKSNSDFFEQAILNSQLRRHPNVIILEEVSEAQAVTVRQINVFRHTFVATKIMKTPQMKTGDLFTQIPMQVST